MKDMFEYLDEKVVVKCTDNLEFKGVVIGMESCLEQDTIDTGFDSITIYNNDIATQLYRNEITDIKIIE